MVGVVGVMVPWECAQQTVPHNHKTPPAFHHHERRRARVGFTVTLQTGAAHSGVERDSNSHDKGGKMVEGKTQAAHKGDMTAEGRERQAEGCPRGAYTSGLSVAKRSDKGGR
jgi:hypothetical protein